MMIFVINELFITIYMKYTKIDLIFAACMMLVELINAMHAPFYSLV